MASFFIFRFLADWTIDWAEPGAADCALSLDSSLAVVSNLHADFSAEVRNSDNTLVSLSRSFVNAMMKGEVAISLVDL